MSRQDFIDQMQTLGYKVERTNNERVQFPYEVSVGKFTGQTIRLGFQVGDDFPLNPPASGPHVSPRLLPLNNQSKAHPADGIHESPFGDEWEYWSRPHREWEKTDRSAKAYMAFIRLLFETQ